MRLLIDEQLSPALVQRLSEQGIFAQHVAHVGMAGKPDREIWRRAYHNDQIVVTSNSGDFLTLARGVELHPGLVVVRESGLSREEQWARLEPIIAFLADTRASLINHVIEVYGPGDFEIRELPPE